jgi:hypothetical protein
MRKLVWIAPALMLLGGCSKDRSTTYAAAQSNTTPAAPAAEVVSAPSPFMPETPSANPQRASRVPAVVSTGTALHVRVDDVLDTRRNRPGDRFSATLVRPVIVNGRTVLPAGARFHGHITKSAESGRLKGRAVLGLTLDDFQLHDRTYSIGTTYVNRVGEPHKKRNVILAGGGAALGAVIGAFAGHGKGAAVGAFAGGATGTAGAAATGKKDVAIAAETPITFFLRGSVKL